MRETIRIVMLTMSPTGRRKGCTVIDPHRCGTDTPEGMSETMSGAMGLMLEVLQGCAYARCIAVGKEAALTPENLDRYGSGLAVAWSAAYSGHLHIQQTFGWRGREGYVLNMTDRTFMAAGDPRLPLTLYVGPSDVVSEPARRSGLLGIWALKALLWAQERPSEDAGWKEVSQHLQGP